jgi:predicted metal-dependent HD superfamily phosphohydrolase
VFSSFRAPRKNHFLLPPLEIKEIDRVADNPLLEKACTCVEALIRERKPEWVKYHDFHHSKSVVEACQAIGEASNLAEEDLEVVTLGAWFHDVGYVEGIDGHEERSVDMATSFLQEVEYPKEKIAQVAGCIRATRMPQNPKNLVEQVLCDADIAHLASKDFLELSERVRLEIEHRMRIKLSELEWLTMNIDFVAGHRYFTDYAKTMFEEQRGRNLEILREKLNRLKTQGDPKSSGSA